MRFAALFSGGKDSTLAILKAKEQGHRFEALISVAPSSDSSYIFHYPNVHLIPKLAQLLERPIVFEQSSGELRSDLEALRRGVERVVENFSVDAISAGVVRSKHQRKLLQDVCGRYGIELLTPNWQQNHFKLIEEALERGFKIVITAVAAFGLDDSWLGKELNASSLEELCELSKAHGIDIGGEGGEYETLVIDCPLYKKRLEIVASRKHWDGSRGWLEVEEVRLQEK